MVYSTRTHVAETQGGFTLWQGSQSLRGQRLAHNTESRLSKADGKLEFNDPDLRLFGDRMESKESSGTVHWEGSVRGYFQATPWRFTASSLDGNSQNYLAHRMNFTSCDRLRPDYHIWSWKGKIWPGRRANFTHAVFFLGPIPFWYWPYYSKTLGESNPYTVYLHPGQNGRVGNFVRSVIAIPMMGDKLYLRQHLDLFGKIGIGLGPEILYRDGESRKGALSLYTIQEQSGLRQWDVRGDSFYEIRPNLSMQGSLRYQRDPTFNNFYSQENPERVSPDLRSSMALNWSRTRYQLRSFYSDVWGFDKTAGKFVSTSRTLPGFEGILHPWGILGGVFQVQGNASAARLQSRSANVNEKPFERWQDSGALKILKPWKAPLIPFINGTVGATFDHSYTSRRAADDPRSLRQSHYGGDLAARVAPWDILDLGLIYTLAWRTEPNSFHRDTASPDRGLDVKRLAITESSRLPLNTSLYARTAYNFPRVAATKPEHWSQNLDPVWASLTSSPLPGFTLGMTTSYDAYAREYNDNLNIGLTKGRTQLTGSFQHDTRTPNYVLPTLSADFSIPRYFRRIRVTWRGEYYSRNDVLSYHKLTLRTMEQDLMLVPDLHDFFVTLVFRNRKNAQTGSEVREFFFTIALKLGKQEEEDKLLGRLNEPEFFPWRAQ